MATHTVEMRDKSALTLQQVEEFCKIARNGGAVNGDLIKGYLSMGGRLRGLRLDITVEVTW